MEDEQIVRLVTENAERSKANSTHIEELKEDIKEIRNKQETLHELTSSVKVIATDMSYLKNSVNEVKVGQKELSDKVEFIEDKGRFDIWLFVKQTLLPALITGGGVYFCMQLINQAK